MRILLSIFFIVSTMFGKEFIVNNIEKYNLDFTSSYIIVFDNITGYKHDDNKSVQINFNIKNSFLKINCYRDKENIKWYKAQNIWFQSDNILYPNNLTKCPEPISLKNHSLFSKKLFLGIAKSVQSLIFDEVYTNKLTYDANLEDISIGEQFEIGYQLSDSIALSFSYEDTTYDILNFQNNSLNLYYRWFKPWYQFVGLSLIYSKLSWEKSPIQHVDYSSSINNQALQNGIFAGFDIPLNNYFSLMSKLEYRRINQSTVLKTTIQETTTQETTTQQTTLNFNDEIKFILMLRLRLW